MSEPTGDPTPLFPIEPTVRLTERDRAVLRAVELAGSDGFNPVATHQERTLRRLRRLGLVRYRLRAGAWTRTGVDAPRPPGMSDEIPY